MASTVPPISARCSRLFNPCKNSLPNGIRSQSEFSNFIRFLHQRCLNDYFRNGTTPKKCQTSLDALQLWLVQSRSGPRCVPLSCNSDYSSAVGIGYHTAQQLALRGAKVYLACRSESKVLDAIAQMKVEYPELKQSDRLHYLVFDLGDLKATKAAALSFQEKETRLDILVNNASL